MSDKKRILFIDDDPSILAGLQTLFHKDRKRWDLVFAEGGPKGLDATRQGRFDVVICDMRMPLLDGASLLSTIRDEHPATVRIMLSGYANRDLIVRALPSLHQLLSKPCDASTLRRVIERSLESVDLERDARILRLVGQVDKLPTPPDVFFDLTRLMTSATAGLDDVTRVIMRDPALSAKVLQLVNSAFFGTGKATRSIQQAVAYLGLEQLRYLALTASVFSAPISEPGCAQLLSEMRMSAMRAARIAREFAEPARRDEVFAATLLHDVGQIAFLTCRGDDARGCLERIAAGEDLLEVELETFGVSHGDVGARLLSIWGLPPDIVEGVQFHHDPGSAPEHARTLASMVHVADVLTSTTTQLNMESLTRAGCAQLVPTWKAIAARMT